MGGLLHLVQPGGDRAGCGHQRPVHQSLYYYMIVRCSAVGVVIKGLREIFLFIHLSLCYTGAPCQNGRTYYQTYIRLVASSATLVLLFQIGLISHWVVVDNVVRYRWSMKNQ